MMKHILVAALSAILILVSAVWAEEIAMKSIKVNLGFEKVPDVHTCQGEDISPKIEVLELNATSMAVIVDDPDAPSGTFTHWLIWNIPPTEVIPEAIPNNATIKKPIQAVQGRNSFGEIGYAGPCPPPGKPHRYFFRVFGLDSMLDLRPGATRQDLEKAMKGHVLAQGEAMATYGR
ncbi:MAG: YbhB/YbcL family Raf kinase inhibitor-like protein [Methanothrix sp.]|nr:YbhB/YbcL family Raf kinase inhibitor-like protein [Methanothrix sp.]